MEISKDTQFYGSFSLNPSGNGTVLFNQIFTLFNINAIYKSFKAENINEILYTVKTADLKGFAISSPYKTKIMEYVHEFGKDIGGNSSLYDLGVCNTIKVVDDKFIGYNTDYFAMETVLREATKQCGLFKFIILGNGALSLIASNVIKNYLSTFSFFTPRTLDGIITRNNWNDIYDVEDSIIVNCTPLQYINIDFKKRNNLFLDISNLNSIAGKIFYDIQSRYQLRIYTGVEL